MEVHLEQREQELQKQMRQRQKEEEEGEEQQQQHQGHRQGAARIDDDMAIAFRVSTITGLVKAPSSLACCAKY